MFQLCKNSKPKTVALLVPLIAGFSDPQFRLIGEKASEWSIQLLYLFAFLKAISLEGYMIVRKILE